MPPTSGGGGTVAGGERGGRASSGSERGCVCFTGARRMRVSFYLQKAGRPQGRAGRDARPGAARTSALHLLVPAPGREMGQSRSPPGGTAAAAPRQPRNRPRPPRAGAAGPPLSPHAPLAESFGVRPHCGRRRRATPIATPCAYPAAPAAAAPDRRAHQPPSHRPPLRLPCPEPRAAMY